MSSGEACRACGGHVEVAFEATDRNRRLSEQSFTYGRCTACGLLRLLDPPNDLAHFYGGEYYRSPPLNELRAVGRREAYQLEHLRAQVPEGHVIEIGAAWGAFALQAKEAGYRVTALEMDGPSVEYLRGTVGVDAIQTDDPAQVLPGVAPADAIVMWQTIEHLPDPFGTLAACLDALRPGGVLMLATPNPQALGFRLLGASWPHVDAPRHLYLIPPEALAGWLRNKGARQVAYTVNDLGARRWNHFAWSRWLMNRVTNRFLQRVAFVLGHLIGLALAPLERHGRNGSSYTAVFRKESS